MIEVTDEMVSAAQEQLCSDAAGCDSCVGDALAAVLAIVERDLSDQAQREWDALEYCPSLDPDHPGWHCEREAGHEGPHRAMRWQLEWAS